MKIKTIYMPFGLMGLLIASGAAEALPPAQYMVTFETRWSAPNHPQDFPVGAHFSPFVGATHDGSVSFWAPGQFATPGIKDVAELGDGTAFLGEINTAVALGSASTTVQGNGFFVSLTPSSSATFTANETHTKLTAVTMLAPSPDWFTGFHDFDLVEDGDWIPYAEFDVQAYDAGTDSGVTYSSADLLSVPPEPITRIDGPPLVNQGAVAPVVHVKIQRIDQPFCSITLNQREYIDGDTVSTVSWRFANLGPNSAAIESKVWVGFLGFDTLSILNDGADGSAMFPAGLDVDYGSFPIFDIDSSFPRGTYELSCRLLDPVTGQIISQDRNEVEVR